MNFLGNTFLSTCGPPSSSSCFSSSHSFCVWNCLYLRIMYSFNNSLHKKRNQIKVTHKCQTEKVKLDNYREAPEDTSSWSLLSPQDSSQIELLKELMDLQKGMVVMLLSMLEGRLVVILSFFLSFYLSSSGWLEYVLSGKFCLFWQVMSWMEQLGNKWLTC